MKRGDEGEGGISGGGRGDNFIQEHLRNQTQKLGILETIIQQTNPSAGSCITQDFGTGVGEDTEGY